MARTFFIVFILTAWNVAHTYSSPVKRTLTDQIARDDCYGTDCYYDPDYFDTSINVKFPENLTKSIMSALPEIEASQSEMVALQNKTFASQEKMVVLLEKMTQSVSSVLQNQDQKVNNISSTLQTITNHLSNVADLLTHQLINQRAPPLPARDCQDTMLKAAGMSRSYEITPLDGLGSFHVFCDMESNGGDWTVFQKRFDGSVDFFRNWQSYENGFGRSDGEYWLGFTKIRRLLSDGRNWTLRIDLERFDGEKAYAEYDAFMIGDEASNYRLTVGSYNGNAGDSLDYDSTTGRHNGMPFSTRDRDNDQWRDHCANEFKAGWWFNACTTANLNGLYSGAPRVGAGIGWATWKNWDQLKKSEMKIRHEQ